MATSPALLFGATSILGYQLARRYPESLIPFITPHRRASVMAHWPVLQLQDRAWIDGVMNKHKPDVLIYCHAVCDVSKCEASPDWAWMINVQQLANVLAALPSRTRLVYVSSDHVFGGDGSYDEQWPTCPISVYGRTRVAAENLVLDRVNSLVVRIGLPIGASSDGRTGHLDWLRYRSKRNLPITIVHDEYRSAVWAADLAERIMALAASPVNGVCHITATRAVSRVELANHLLADMSLPPEFRKEGRRQRSAPHLGRVELATLHRGLLFEPLQSPLDRARTARKSAEMLPKLTEYSIVP